MHHSEMICFQLFKFIFHLKTSFIHNHVGELPISVDMDALPNGLLADDNEMPPPIPPKITEDDPLPKRTTEREFNSM
jgi:hypothetical protein